MKTQHAAPGPARLIPLAAVTLTNYAAQVPYYLHNDYSAHHLLPGVRAVALLGVTLAWFALGLAGFMRHRRWGFAVLASFLVVEAVFYAGNFVTGVFIFQIENHSDLMKAVFVIGYVSGAVAAYYAYRIVRDRFRPSLRVRADPAR
jgi:O-antigen/teichoic acid export membrane protein